MNPIEKDELRAQLQRDIETFSKTTDYHGMPLHPAQISRNKYEVRKAKYLLKAIEAYEKQKDQKYEPIDGGMSLNDFGKKVEHPQPLDAGESVNALYYQWSKGNRPNYQSEGKNCVQFASYVLSQERKKWEASITAKEKEWVKEKAELVEKINNYGRHQYNGACLKLDLIPFEKWEQTNKIKTNEKK